MKVLFISYDGAMDVLGQSQIIPYLRGLSGKGADIALLSFEKAQNFLDDDKRPSLKEELSKDNIKWHPLRYHKRPLFLAKIYDVIAGVAAGLRIIKKEKIEIIHARIFVGAFIAFVLKKVCNKKFIFDIRGMWADERVDGNIWSRGGCLYRVARSLERRMLLNSDAAVVLTESLKKELKIKNSSFCSDIKVIPTCVDLELFSVRGKDIKENKEKKLMLIYAGSVGTVYMIDEMFRFFVCLKNSIDNAYFTILSSVGHELAVKEAAKHGLSEQDFEIESIDHNDIPDRLSRADIGLAFYKPNRSMKGRSPTKIGEYLACGLPVVINKGVGDCDDFITKDEIGVVVEDFSPSSYNHVVQKIKTGFLQGDSIKDRCRKAALKYFSLEDGVDRYLEVYKNLV